MENDYLGLRRIESLQKEDADWQRKAHMAVLSIQDLTVKYFEITAKAQKGDLLSKIILVKVSSKMSGLSILCS